MDFAQLRSSVFDAEEESVQSTPIRDQLRNPSVGFPLLLGICSLGLWGVDKFVQDNQLLTSEGEYDYRPMVFSVMGLFPLGFGLGGLLRGLEANEESEKYEEILGRLKFRSFTFDSCQGEERDIIYYSFVANPEKDRLWAVLPKSMSAQDEEELDRNKKLQRMNVAFSRGKPK